MHIRVLMFGWEFPPMNDGGLGVACYGLAKALARHNVEILLVLPYHPGKNYSFLKLIPLNIKPILISSSLREYATPPSYLSEKKEFSQTSSIYGKNLFGEVLRYTECARQIAREYDFDIIHAHDWMTYQAGLAAKEVSGKPLVLHVHSIEHDRTGGNGRNQWVWNIEKHAMERADAIFPVSNYTKRKIIEEYCIPEGKIEVIHNAIEPEDLLLERIHTLKKHHKIILFIGRITLQKGPEYFIGAAKKALEQREDLIFIMAGSGDMQHRMMHHAAQLGISDKLLFTGFLRGEKVKEIYAMADVFVAPSVSEPFGLTILEAMNYNVPVIVSKNAGVSEVIRNCLKVDFWDTHEIANKILALLNYSSLNTCLRENAQQEIRKITWDASAKKVISIYQNLIQRETQTREETW